MRANPFQEKSLLKSNTYLLNYGEDNLTMYRSLTKKETSSNGRGNVIAETNILNRVRKEAYEARKYKQNEDSSLYLDNSRLQQQRQCDSFWKTISKVKSTKTIRNPFSQSYASTDYGTFEVKKKGHNQREGCPNNIERQKTMIRQEVGELKSQLLRQNSQSKYQKPHHFSVCKLYKGKRVSHEQQSMEESLSEYPESSNQKSTDYLPANKPPAYPKPKK